MLPLFLMSLSPITSSPLSSTSPEIEDDIYQLEEKVQIVEQARTKRSITALLAAEVIFLEGILAAQNSKKAKARKVVRPVTNHIYTTVDGKHIQAYPSTVKQDQAYSSTVKQDLTTTTTIPSTTQQPISQLDPFTMLDAPDLSRKPADTKREAFQVNKAPVTDKQRQIEQPKYYPDILPKYGEFELYKVQQPVQIVPQPKTEKSKISSTPIPSSSTTSQISSVRQPRKIKNTMKYGAFELYVPSFVLKHKGEKGKAHSFAEKSTSSARKIYFKQANFPINHKKDSQSHPLTYFTAEQAKKVHKSDTLPKKGKVKRVKKKKKLFDTNL